MQPRPQDKVYDGQCGPKEYCYTRNDGPLYKGERVSTAWCIPATCFVNLATAVQQTHWRAAEIELEEQREFHLSVAMYELSELYEAVFIEIEPMDSEDRVLHYPVSCSSCSTLSYAQTPPDGTTKFRVTVQVQIPEDEPDLHVLNQVLKWMDDL